MKKFHSFGIRMTAAERAKGRLMRAPDGHEELTSDVNVADAISDISSSLFGQGGDDDAPASEVGAEQVEQTPTDRQAPPQDQKPASEQVIDQKPAGEQQAPDNSQAVQETGAPKTWTAEAVATWATIPPRAQQEILKREQDMFQGLSQYREAANLGAQYDKVVEPFRQQLQAENVNPVELFQNFANNHYMLSRGTPEQKVTMAANLLQHYGIDLTAVVAAAGNYVPPNPEVQALQQRLDQRDQQDAQARQGQIKAELDAFIADPDNIYFEEVASDIASLIKTGAAQSLKQAYDMAVWNNPTTRAKEIDRMAAERDTQRDEAEAKRVQAANAAQATHVTTTTKTRDGTEPVGSMDETLDETMRKIQARG